MKETRKPKLRLVSREDGVISVEFVILFPVIVMVVLGILEFGHLWQVRHVLTIASREGARAGVVYVDMTDGNRIIWAKSTAEAAVDNFLANTTKWVKGTDYTVTIPAPIPGPSGLTGGTLTVQVQVNQALLVLHKMIKPITIVTETTMRFE